MLFQVSSYNEEGWPVPDKRRASALDTTKRALRVLISLLYGAQVNADQIGGYKEAHRYGVFHQNSCVIDTVACVCAHAEYLGCLDYIKPGITKAMQSAPGYWTAVSAWPEGHMALASKLQNADIYYDAMRHLVAGAYLMGDWSRVIRQTGYNEHTLRSFYEPQLQGLPEVASKLELDILKLQLNDIEVYHGSWYTTYTTFLNALGSKKSDRSEADKTIEKFGFIARAILGQWFLQQLYGDDVRAYGHRRRGETAG